MCEANVRSIDVSKNGRIFVTSTFLAVVNDGVRAFAICLIMSIVYMH